VRLGSRVAEFLATIENASAEHLKNDQHDNRPELRLERIEESVGHRDAVFALVEHYLASRCEGKEVRDGSAPLGLSEAPPAEEQTARSAHCSVAPERDTLVEEVSVDRMKVVSRMQVKLAADGRLVSNNGTLHPASRRKEDEG
jgi:hypothetical protein